jgi:hypothetical protein
MGFTKIVNPTPLPPMAKKLKFYFFLILFFLNGNIGIEYSPPTPPPHFFIFFSYILGKFSPLGDPQKKGLKILQM